MNLTNAAERYEKAGERQVQTDVLMEAARGWSESPDKNASWVRACVSEGRHSMFLCDMVSVLHRPEPKLRDFCLESALETLEQTHWCDLHTYLVLHAARLLTTNFDFWEELMRRGVSDSPARFRVVANLLECEDRWGFNPPVDTRLRWNGSLQNTLLQTGDVDWEIALSEFLVVDGKTSEAVVEKLERHSHSRVRALTGSCRSMPEHLWPWWYNHLYGRGTTLAGVDLDTEALRLSAEDMEWALEAMGHPRLRLFVTFLLQTAHGLHLSTDSLAVFRSAYRKARVHGAWCFFGNRVGNWNGAAWASFLAERFPAHQVTPIFMERPTGWHDMNLLESHCWCEPDFGPAERYRELLALLGARGLALYRVDGLEVVWSGFVGEPWVGPPKNEWKLLTEDGMGTSWLCASKDLATEAGEDSGRARRAAIAHLRIPGPDARGIFLYRWMRPDRSGKRCGLFSQESWAQALEYRNLVWGAVEN